MNDQVKLFLKNKGIELTSFVTNVAFVLTSIVYVFNVLLSVILFIERWNPEFVREAWMVVPDIVTLGSLLGLCIYGLYNVYEDSYSIKSAILNGFRECGIIIAFLAMSGFIAYLIVGFIGTLILLISDVVSVNAILPNTVFQLSFITFVIWGIPTWLMSNWEQAKRGEKSYFKPIWDM